MAGGGIELTGVRTLEAGQRTGRLDDHDLEAQAEAEQRDVVLARIARRRDLSLHAALTEAARDDQAVVAPQCVVLQKAGDGGRLDPFDLHLAVSYTHLRA